MSAEVPTSPGDTASLADTAAGTARVPDHSWRWPVNPLARPCLPPLENLNECWRHSPRVASQEPGFPGLRAHALDLSSLERLRVEPFFQAALGESPYGGGGHMPFGLYEESRGMREVWAPVQPLDTPVTDLHWMRGALSLNQFGLGLRRMAGNRAYLGLEFHTGSSDSRFYQYAFNVHQPYLGLGRDSLSLVIQDSSHSMYSRQVRPRVGYWIDERTVVEAHADWLLNETSLTHPANPARNDSMQSLFPAEFSAVTLGGTLARSAETYSARIAFRHAVWDRDLSPRGDSAIAEDAAGIRDLLETEVTLPGLPGAPRATLTLENDFHHRALWTEGAGGSPADRARSDRESFEVRMLPSWGDASFDVRGLGARRRRADGLVEWLGGAEGAGGIHLPLGFRAAAFAGAEREGASEDRLFRRQAALGLYPNPDLAPRTEVRFGAKSEWISRHLELGLEWGRLRFADNWLPRVLPRPDVCFVLADSANYPGEAANCAGGRLPDSLALAHVNHASETRDLLHLSGMAALGNWRLSLRHTAMLRNAVEDPRLGFTGANREIPDHVFKGRLLWRRHVLDGRLGLQTQWDWEWFSARYAFASDGDGWSRVLMLDEYLALDFTARMEIQTFLLYFRAMNLYHDRYATEPGVHPPGVNFRFGVDWRLRN